MASIETDNAIPCPACFAGEISVPPLEPLETQDLHITLPSKGETISFTAATKTFIEEHYPHLNRTTYRVPAAFFYDHKGDLDLKTNDEIRGDDKFSQGRGSTKKSSSEVIIDRFQKDAVEKVVRRFYTWGASRGKGMMILSEYKIQDYLRAVKAGTGCKKRKKLVGDHDVMVLHFGKGVVFVQVKSVQATRAWKTIRGQLRSAFQQVIKDEGVFRELNADLGSFISAVPVLQFVALPELSFEHLRCMGVCEEHGSRVLTKEILESPSEFDEYFSKHLRLFGQKESESFTTAKFTELCGRYVGLASVVRIRTLSDAVKKTSAKVGKILLTPEQSVMIKAGTRRQIILGEYGTGKSLVLVQMAEKILARENGCLDARENIVFVVSCTGVSHTRTMGRLRRSPNHLVAHLGKLVAETSSAIKIMSIADLFHYCFPDSDPYSRCLNPATMAELTRKIKAMHPNAHIHIFWDEAPFVPKWEWSPLKELGDEHPDTFIWVTIATGTYITMDPGDPTSSVARRIPQNFAISQLTRSMRMTRNGFKFYRALQEYLGDKGCCSTESGNAIDGGIPMWYPMPDCFCETSDPVNCTCIQSRLSHTLENVWRLLKDIDPSQVSIVLRDSKRQVDRFLFRVVIEACRSLNIPVSYSPSFDGQDDDRDHSTSETSDQASEPRCQIVDIFSYKGCESPVVISVTPYGWPLVLEHHSGRHGWDDISPQISRALGQIFLITWPRREMDHFSRDAVLNMISTYSAFTAPENEEEAEFLEKMKEKLYDVLDMYSREDHPDFLAYLVEKDVLVKCKV